MKANLKKTQKTIEKEKEKVIHQTVINVLLIIDHFQLKELEGVPAKYTREMEQLDEKIKSLEVH